VDWIKEGVRPDSDFRELWQGYVLKHPNEVLKGHDLDILTSLDPPPSIKLILCADIYPRARPVSAADAMPVRGRAGSKAFEAADGGSKVHV
jgi:hypothetical protein